MSEHDKIFAASSRLTDAFYELQRLSNAFEATGNPTVSDALRVLADEIETARTEIREATAVMLDGRLRDAQQGSANMLNLTLALLGRVDKAEGLDAAGEQGLA